MATEPRAVSGATQKGQCREKLKTKICRRFMVLCCSENAAAKELQEMIPSLILYVYLSADACSIDKEPSMQNSYFWLAAKVASIGRNCIFYSSLHSVNPILRSRAGRITSIKGNKIIRSRISL